MGSCRECGVAIALMNELAGTRFRDHGATVRNLHARHQEYGAADVQTVVRRKAAAWLGDPRMSRYFRPSTLFRPSHFDEYLNEPEPSRRWGTVDYWGRCALCTRYGHGSDACPERGV